MSRTSGTIRVLHVDDEPEFVDLAATFLEREYSQFIVETATSPSDGLDRLADAEFDCIVSDYEMPGQNGIEFLEAVRLEHPELPFILYTGKGSEEIASNAISAGVTDYVQKRSGTNQYVVLANRVKNAVEGFRSQQALTKRNQELQRYKQAVDSMHEAACIYDSEGRFDLVNEYLAEWYNSTPEGLAGEQGTLIAKIREQADGDPFQELLLGERNEIQGELDDTFPDHGYAVLDYRLTPLRPDDTVEAVVGVARDITEQKQRERQLKQKTEELEQLATEFETQYRTLFEEAPVMTVLTRAEDGEPIIEDCNSLFVETLGYNADAILNRELAEFYTSESAETLLEEDGYRRSLEGKFNREKRELVTAGGDIVETLLRAVPRHTADGEIIGTMAMYIDITERESVKRANERLEEFTGVVSHDLRSPLNVATGRLDLVAEECDSDHLDDIEQALGRMETLIGDLLTLAREGKEVTDTQPVDLATMIDECWETVRTKQAVLTVYIDRRIQADRSRLKQVFENLFRNAVKHGGADVTVTVGELDNGFYIEDNGPGIPSDERADIFEAGYSRSADGTGFGLSIVEQVVTAHDWQIRVTDGADGGARFEVTDVEFVAL